MAPDQLGLLESADEIAIAGTIHYFSRKFGFELGEQVDVKLKTHASPNWFQTLKQARQDAGFPTYDDVHDPRFLLKECLDENGIVHFGISGFDSEWKLNAATLRRKLNAWFHGSLEPTLTTFIQVVGLFSVLAAESHLPISSNLLEALNRARAIDSGIYKPKKESSNWPQNSDDAEFAKRLRDKKAAIQKRPPVGSEWTGSKGTRKIVISKTLNDVTEQGISIKSQLGSDPDAVIKSWLRYYPLGGEAKVAEDGAVMGFRFGQAYLIGWLGQEQQNVMDRNVQGFVLPFDYIFTGDDVRDLSSGKLLSVDATEDPARVINELAQHVQEGEFFAATPYGELIQDRDQEKSILLAHVHKDIWFKGHLPG